MHFPPDLPAPLAKLRPPARAVMRRPNVGTRASQTGLMAVILSALLAAIVLAVFVWQRPPSPPFQPVQAAPPVVQRSPQPAQLPPPEPAPAPVAAPKPLPTIKLFAPRELAQCLPRGSHLLDNKVARCRFGSRGSVPMAEADNVAPPAPTATPKELERCLARGSNLLNNAVARCRFGTPDGAPTSDQHPPAQG